MNLYLSKLVLNPRNRAVQRDIYNCQSMHKRVMSAFDNLTVSNPRKKIGVLYRLNTVQYGNAVVLLIQSGVLPDWSVLSKNYLVEGVENLAVKDITKLFESLKLGLHYAFELVACPTKKVGTITKEERLAGRKGNGRRIPLKGFEARMEWLEKKGNDHGFCIITADAAPQPATYGVHAIKDIEKMKHQGVVYRGVLKITELSLFKEVMQMGIGPARAYGFGMIMLYRRVG